MSKILIIVDQTDKKQIALSRGLELAKAMSVDVEAVCFTHEYLKAVTDDPSSQADLKAHLIKTSASWLQNQLNQLDLQGIKVTSKVIWSKQLEQWVSKRCQQQSFQAVIKTGHRSETFLHTPTDWQLLRECPAPVLIVAEKKWRKSQPILAALDLGSSKRNKQKLNQQVLQSAAHYASALNAELHVVYCIHISEVLQDLDIINRNALTQKRKAELAPVIDKIRSSYGLSKQQLHIRAGVAHKVIPSVADKIKADLVVMGVVSTRRRLLAHIIGNTAEKVLTHLRTDVLALKPEH